MTAHIIGGGFGGLAAAALLIRNAGVSGENITIYEADEQVGGGFFLGGSAESGYNLPGSVFDKEFRCTFELLKSIPSASNPSTSVTEEFFAFNTGEPYHDRGHIFDRDGRVVHGPRFGLSLGDGLSLARVLLTPEAMLDGRRIMEFFSRRFFSTEFWLLWSTIMGSLPEHSAIEFRRYMNRFLYLFGHLSDMTGVMRTPINQHQAFIEPLVAWLRPRGVNFLTGAFVQDIGFAPLPGRMTVDRLDFERGGSVTSIAVAPEDLVLVTTGSQAADLSVGSMTEAPQPRPSGRSWALWTRLAKGRPKFGKPDVFFGEARIPLSRWVTFTVTDRGTEFIEQISALTGSEPGRGGLVTLKDSGWVLSLSVFHQPEIIGQPPGTSVWWGYGLVNTEPGCMPGSRNPLAVCWPVNSPSINPGGVLPKNWLAVTGVYARGCFPETGRGSAWEAQRRVAMRYFERAATPQPRVLKIAHQRRTRREDWRCTYRWAGLNAQLLRAQAVRSGEAVRRCAR
jgi:oleate hydratase